MIVRDFPHEFLMILSYGITSVLTQDLGFSYQLIGYSATPVLTELFNVYY